jgi:hypothetical protein
MPCGGVANKQKRSVFPGVLGGWALPALLQSKPK